MTKRSPVSPAPGPLEDYAHSFDDLFGGLAPAPWLFRESDESGPGSRRVEKRVLKLPERTARATGQSEAVSAVAALSVMHPASAER